MTNEKTTTENSFTIDKQQFGTFITKLRKEKGYTQKDIAKKLFISDKAVSKWERGLSMPDISLLVPLAEVLEITVTELLKYQRLETSKPLNTEQVEEIVKKAIHFSKEYPTPNLLNKKTWCILYVSSLFLFFIEFGIFLSTPYSIKQIPENLAVGVFLSIFMGLFFCFFLKETLPSYYDENKIHGHLYGIFRIQLLDVAFNNHNYPYILFVGRMWSVCMITLFPIIYVILSHIFEKNWHQLDEIITLILILGTLFIPMYIVGKKYE